MRCGCFVGVVIQVLYTSLGCEGENELEVGRLKKLLLKKDNGTITFEIYLNVTAKAQSPALRLSVSCKNATIRHPLLVTVQQVRGVASWSIPYAENGYAYSFTERTLCPFLSIELDDPNRIYMVTVKLSTSSPTPIDVQLSSAYFKQFYQRLNHVTTLTASPSAPAYLLFEYPPDLSEVHVRFSSMDSTSNVCAIASIQKTYCPVVEMVDNPDHRGVFQTMRSQAAINVELLRIANETTTITDRQQTSHSFFYIVVSVFNSSETCMSTQLAKSSGLLTLEVVDNFNPTLINSQVLFKNINITIEPALPDWIYGMSVVVPFLIFSLFYVVALVWILITDWIGFHNHPMAKLLDKRLSRLKELIEQQQVMDPSDPPPAKLEISEINVEHSITKAMCDKIKRMQFSDEKETSLEIIGTRGMDGTDIGSGIDRTPAHLSLQQNNKDSFQSSATLTLSLGRNTRSGRKIFEHIPLPSLHSVLMGSQYGKALEDVITPTPHYPQYLHKSTTSRSCRPRPKFRLVLTKSHHTNYEDGNATSIGASIPSISLTRPVVEQVTTHSHCRMGLDSLSISKENDEVDSYIGKEGKGRQQESQENAIQVGTIKDGDIQTDTKSFDMESGCIKLCRNGEYMSDLEEFDETCHIQEKYSLLSWYLVAAIIFYAIPAYQLVITYQQLLNLSGNHDLCYFNSLCSFPWHSPLITFTAFNNLYSNIGYFMLGFLCILISYRRQRMYRAVVEVINNPFITSKSERVGVPQYFGISYAMGLSIIAIGLMSIAYHICPGKINFQFDTTFMYIMASLGIFKLLESRSPDLKPGLHKLLVLVACMILFVVVGVMYPHNPVFYAIFFIVHITGTFVVTVQIYYHWKICFWKWDSLKKFYEDIVSRPIWPPSKKSKWVLALTTNVINWQFALYAVVYRPLDFGTFFLFILLANFILLFMYYSIMKLVYREWPSFRPILFLILALIFWSCGVYFFSLTVTNWLMSPAESRDGNKACIALFFDSHDMWHFSSALALFFSFLMLTTIDDNAEATVRTELRVF